jgi:H+-transporting ATPase
MMKGIGQSGLTSEDAELRLKKYGLNALREKKRHPFISFLQKFWAPVPWMLEVIILIEIILGRSLEAWVIGALIVFNAFLSFYEEGKARSALSLLKEKLDVQARCLRDGTWKLIAAQLIVPDDVICIQMGDFVPADLILIQGSVSLDQSAITGESMPTEPSVGEKVYAGSIVRHGDAYAKVTATGKNTFFGKTVEIMSSTKTPSHLQKLIFSIVRALIIFEAFLILFMSVYSLHQEVAFSDLLPFSLLLLVACVPVALPATYALSTALGSIELSKKGVLVTRLSAIEEAAAMNVLCVDKTGTITQNVLTISHLRPLGAFTEEDLLVLAALVCEEATQDSLDLAILSASQGKKSRYLDAIRKEFIPFDPKRKCAEAVIEYQGEELHILKGAPQLLLEGIHEKKDFEELSSDGSRLLAVILRKKRGDEVVGLIAFYDPPRPTSKAAIQEIHNLGIRIKMMTGDGLSTAKFIAKQVGIGSQAISREAMQTISEEAFEKCDVISGVFPEDKFRMIQLLQNKGFICGMTGDGVNDAPALKKAEVGIAVSNATDVAKAAASLVLKDAGLETIVEAIKTSRRIYQRMLTYVLNKIIKTLEISILLCLGLFVANEFIISNLLIVLLLFANDFVTMSLSTDRVSYSKTPDRWDIKRLFLVGGGFAMLVLAFSIFAVFVAIYFLHLSITELRTWVFLVLVFTGQAMIYVIRERHHFWHSLPSHWMILCSCLDVILVSFMAIKGYLMAPLSMHLVVSLFLGVAAYFVFLDYIKVKLFPLLRL